MRTLCFCPIVSSIFLLLYGHLWNTADHYIFILSFVLLLLSSSCFPRLISAAVDWMSAKLSHMVWP